MVLISEKWLFTVAFIRVVVPPLWDKGCVDAKWFLLQGRVEEGLGGHFPGAGAAKMQYWAGTAVPGRSAQVSYRNTHELKSEAIAGCRCGGETQKDQSNATNGLKHPGKGSPRVDPVTASELPGCRAQGPITESRVFPVCQRF